ncbi:MAG: NADH-quinone oxidoreductase subunit M [Candidatus Bipolaricaulota bacterium]|nr:NADH-quinone oxidoreductase subunit M [Candidatus Bipolaricaulota bacterium]
MISLSLLILLGGMLLIGAVRDERVVKSIAVLASGVVFALALSIWPGSDWSLPGWHYLEAYEWIPAFGIQYKVGLDGISMPMYVLTALLTFLSCIFSWDVKTRVKEYFALFLLLEIAILGVFVALDLFLFYVFWEVVLVPMYLIINLWGGPRKEYAAIKFFLYTFLASLIMLVGIIALYLATGAKTFDLTELIALKNRLAPELQIWIFAALFVGFVVKMPQVPVHTWLPDAHVEAPTAGSVLLAGVLLKMGSYGIIRVSVPLLPAGFEFFQPILIFIGVLSIIYGAFVCLAQQDLKRLVAYSSISHMGAVLLGIALGSEVGIVGAVYMMFAHGLISPLLFMIVGAIQHGVGTREIRLLGGVALKLPKAGFIITTGALASAGLPGMVQFIAEFLIFVETYRVLGLLVLLPLLTVIITAGYYLWALRRAVFGEVSPTVAGGHDVKSYEFWPMLVLIILIIFFGVWPAPLLSDIAGAVKPLVTLLGRGVP